MAYYKHYGRKSFKTFVLAGPENVLRKASSVLDQPGSWGVTVSAATTTAAATTHTSVKTITLLCPSSLILWHKSKNVCSWQVFRARFIFTSELCKGVPLG
jgi:hypothetical protein